jgi:hypothetical protein
MAAKPPTSLKDIVNRIDQQTENYTERLIHMTLAMEAHIEADAAAFRTLGAQIIEVNQDVKSLLATRSFLRGTWFAVGVFGTLVVTVGGLIAKYWPYIVSLFQ